MDTVSSLIAAIGLALVRLLEKVAPSAEALEDHAATVGWLFVVMFGLVIVASVTGLHRR